MRLKRTGGIVMTSLLSLLLVTGCSGKGNEPTQGKGRDGTPAKKAESDKPLTLDLGDGVTMKFVRIEAGKFTMGSPETEKDRSKNEGPQRQVTISSPFYMGVTEVTQSQYKAVMGTQPWEGQRYAKAGADNAASYINWDEATAFCVALSKKTGRTVRLPTEAEWEYACRAGTTTAYGFGDDASRFGDYAWYDGNAYDKDETYAHPVGAKKPNAWGLYDMHGNVYEWCADWYADSYANADARDPKGPATGSARVLRGGSWLSIPQRCRAAYRSWGSPDGRDVLIGFRVVVLPHPVSAKKPNAWGLYDMHGNVWEWCGDWYADSYANADTRDPKGPTKGEARVLRGGSWYIHPLFCRAASRFWFSPDYRYCYVGFRVLVDKNTGSVA